MPALFVLVPAALLPALRGFDGLYGQDAFGYTGYAFGPLREAIGAGQLPPAFFWPPGFPLLLLLTDEITGWGDASGRLVSLVAGALLPVLVLGLARELMLEQPGAAGGRRAIAIPLLAAAIVAVAGHLWQSSVVAMSDTAAAALATASAVAACRYRRNGRLRWLVAAAALATFAIETRWVFGLVAPTIAIVALARLAVDARTAPARAAIHATAASSVVIVVALPAALPMLTAAVAGGPIPFTADFAAYSWDPAAAFRSTTVTLDGVQRFSLPTGAFYLLQPLQPYWFGLLGLLAVPGVAVTLRTRSIPRWALLLAWPGLVLGFLAGSGYQNTRFLLAAAPPIAILAALGAGAAWDVAAHLGARALAARRLLALAVVASLVVSALIAVRFTDAFIDRQARDLTAIRGLAALVPPEGRILTIGATPVLDHDGARETAELYDLDPSAALALVADGRPSFVLVDRRAIDDQWRAENPGRSVAALEAGPGLAEVATGGAWTLYVVGAAP